MSIAISLGSSPQDIANLKKTSQYLTLLLSALDSTNQNYKSDIESLLEWYNDILRILFNGGMPEEFLEQS